MTLTATAAWYMLLALVSCGMLVGIFKRTIAHHHALMVALVFFMGISLADVVKEEVWYEPLYTTLAYFGAALTAVTFLKPYWLPSNSLNKKDMYLAFYTGSKAPFLAKASSVFGLPVYGMAVIYDGVAIVPNGETGFLESRPAEALDRRSSPWIKINTRVYATDARKKAFDDLEGSSIDTSLGPIGCLYSLKGFLKELGPKFEIGTCITPGAYLSKVLKVLDNNKGGLRD